MIWVALWFYVFGFPMSFMAFSDSWQDTKRNWRYNCFIAVTWPIAMPVALAGVALHFLKIGMKGNAP